jgi:hypothetical protein
MRYFAGFQQTRYFAVYVYDFANIAWAKDQSLKVASTRNYPSNDEIQNHQSSKLAASRAIPGICSVNNCGSASASMLRNGEGYINVSVGNGQTAAQEKAWAQSGAIAHGYAHTVQFAQFIGSGNEVKASEQPNPPLWFFEGLSSATAWYNNTGNLADYNRAHFGTAFNFRGAVLKSLTATTFTNFLLYSSSTQTIDENGNMINANGFTTGPARPLGNQVGGLAVEALIAIAGPQAVFALYSLVTAGVDFDTAFHKVFGSLWSEAAPILGAVLATEYAQTPHTLN